MVKEGIFIREQKFVFLTYFWVMLMLLVWKSSFETHRFRTSSESYIKNYYQKEENICVIAYKTKRAYIAVWLVYLWKESFR